MTDFFQCEIFVSERYPDRMTLWPRDKQDAARRAVMRLMEKNPEKVVSAEESYCIDNTNFIWPEDPSSLPRDRTHALIYRVTLADAST